MLFKTRFYDGLRDGSIDLTFRRWSKLQVKVGGTYRIVGSGGALVVDSVETVAVGAISSREAKRAGFESVDELKSALASKESKVTARTKVYRIAFHFVAETERKAPARATAADVEKVVARLERMDRLSSRGAWTRQVLGLIAKHPKRRAGDLAPMVKREQRAFKADVRKLKGLGLTTSHEVGYELTPLGRGVLARL